jgi:hypothetical protein
MVFRLAEEPVLDGVGGPVVVTFDPPVGTETAVDIVVEAAVVVSTVATVVETSVDTDTDTELEGASDTEAAEDDGAAVVAAVVAAPGRLNVTLAAKQSSPAAWMVCSNSAAEQALWTHGVRAVTNPEALQIQAMSEV